MVHIGKLRPDPVSSHTGDGRRATRSNQENHKPRSVPKAEPEASRRGEGAVGCSWSNDCHVGAGPLILGVKHR